jgi:LysR family hydrogen peroxide-inducible transcriptional activator
VDVSSFRYRFGSWAQHRAIERSFPTHLLNEDDSLELSMRLAPHPFTLRQLQYLVAVAEELSFRRAAERCHVSQPSLSAQIAQVESVLGVQLFERRHRKVLVTLAGRDIVERARRLLVDADDLMEAGRRASDPQTGTISIGVIPTIAPYLLPAAAPALRAEFRRLTVTWREDKTDELIKALHSGALDAALVALEAEIGDVEEATVGRDPFVLALPPNHALARGGKAPVDASELRGEDVLLLDEGHCFRKQALEVCSTGRARESEFRATSLTTLVQMVAGGVGITLLPAIAVPIEASRAGLRVRPIASTKAYRTIALVWRPRSPLGRTLREVARVLCDAFPKPNQRRPRAREAPKKRMKASSSAGR